MQRLTKNPYDPATPEWQLCENAISNDRLTTAYAADAERFQKMSCAAREKADKYWEALEKLTK